jgi:ribonuclease P protein subunit RPR2
MFCVQVFIYLLSYLLSMCAENKAVVRREQKINKRESSRKRQSFRRRRDSLQEIAKSRMENLFSEAEGVYSQDKILANRYASLAYKLSTRYKVPFTKEQKMRFCKHCGSFLKQGQNASFRLSKGNMVVKCFSCKSVRRLGYKQK